MRLDNVPCNPRDLRQPECSGATKSDHKTPPFIGKLHKRPECPNSGGQNSLPETKTVKT
jgi:hypothetical protein